MFCLLKKDADNFRDELIKGNIDPAQLSQMDSAARRSFFEGIVGKENSADVNRLFESKLLLKNQNAAMANWAKEVLGMKPKAKRDLLSRIERNTNILTPANQKAFLEDLARQKMGVGVTFDEAKKINDMAMEASKRKADLASGKLTDRFQYGLAQAELENYVSDLKRSSNRITFADFRANPAKATLRGIAAIPGATKGIQASLDNSAVFRQGWKTMFTNPVIWGKNAARSFLDLKNSLKGQDVDTVLRADIVSRENYDLMRKAKLDIGGGEEAFPTSLPEKIPFFRRLYKASESAYSGFVKKTRADIFDKMIQIGKDSNIEFTDQELQNVGRFVNALTGRGNLGKLEQAGSAINSVLFSPKFIKSHLDVLLQPVTGGASLSEFGSGDNSGSNLVRQEAGKNLLKIVVGNAIVLGIAKAIQPDSVEFDPRSADFGKIRISDTRFDVSGGMASLAVLSARLLTGKTKSGDKFTSLNETDKSGKAKFGGKTALDLVEDFFEGKASPIANVAIDFLKGETRDKQKPTLLGEATSLITPLPIKNAVESFQKPNAANPLLAILADSLGIATNTYSSEKDIQRQIKQAEITGDKEKVEQLKKAKTELQDREKQKKQDAMKAQRLESDKNLSPEKRQQLINTYKKQIKSSKYDETKARFQARIDELEALD